MEKFMKMYKKGKRIFLYQIITAILTISLLMGSVLFITLTVPEFSENKGFQFLTVLVSLIPVIVFKIIVNNANKRGYTDAKIIYEIYFEKKQKTIALSEVDPAMKLKCLQWNIEIEKYDKNIDKWIENKYADYSF